LATERGIILNLIIKSKKTRLKISRVESKSKHQKQWKGGGERERERERERDLILGGTGESRRIGKVARRRSS